MIPAALEERRSSIDPESATAQVRVLLVEDQRLFAEVVSRSLQQAGLIVLGIATTGQEALDIARIARPDVVVMDFGLPGESGLLVGQRIMEEGPGTKIIGLTGFAGARAAHDARRSGFRGCLTKDANVARLTGAIRRVAAGGLEFPRVAHRQDESGSDARFATAWPAEHLTAREQEILGTLASGASTDQIASTLRISQHTVRTHIRRIMQKLVVHSRLEAVAFAVRYGLVAALSEGLSE